MKTSRLNHIHNNDLHYLEYISINNPEVFKTIEVEFVGKRTREHWNECIGKRDNELCSKSNTSRQKSRPSLISQFKPFYTVGNKTYQTVTTEHSELASGVSTSLNYDTILEKKINSQ